MKMCNDLGENDMTKNEVSPSSLKRQLNLVSDSQWLLCQDLVKISPELSPVLGLSKKRYPSWRLGLR